MEKLETTIESQSHFSKGLICVKEYYAEKGAWDVGFKVIYKDFKLGAWWISTRRSISIGSLHDEQITMLLDSGIPFDIKPIFFIQWLEMVRLWTEANGAFPSENGMQGDYCVGKWFRRNKKEYEYWCNKYKNDSDTVQNERTVGDCEKIDVAWEGCMINFQWRGCLQKKIDYHRRMDTRKVYIHGDCSNSKEMTNWNNGNKTN